MVSFVLPLSVIEIREYIDSKGRNSFGRWFEKQDGTTRARIAVALGRLEQANFAGTKSAGSGVSELRLDFGPGYRIYFGRDGETIVILLGGGTKKRQQTDIEIARGLWQEYKRQKREE
jgi:putative addiction module killer protein